MSPLSFLYSYKEVLSIVIPALIAFFLGLTFSTKKTKHVIAKKRFYAVYLPIFKTIEPYLYKELSREEGIEVINLVNKLINRHYELFEPNCLQAYKSFRNGFLSVTPYDQRHFEDFCRYIDREYEELKRKLHLPRRTIGYKLSMQQIPKNFRIILDEILEKVTRILITISILLALIMISRLILLIIHKFIVI